MPVLLVDLDRSWGREVKGVVKEGETGQEVCIPDLGCWVAVMSSSFNEFSHTEFRCLAARGAMVITPGVDTRMPTQGPVLPGFPFRPGAAHPVTKLRRPRAGGQFRGKIGVACQDM